MSAPTRCPDNRKNFSGKHKAHGLLFLALTDEKGNLIWISAAKPGRSSEITAARHNKITSHLREAGLGALADLGFVGLDDDPDDPVVITGRRATCNHRLTDAEKEANRLLNRECAAVEHGFANLKSWRFLTTIRMNARHATTSSGPYTSSRTPKSTGDRRSPEEDHMPDRREYITAGAHQPHDLRSRDTDMQGFSSLPPKSTNGWAGDMASQQMRATPAARLIVLGGVPGREPGPS